MSTEVQKYRGVLHTTVDDSGRILGLNHDPKVIHKVIKISLTKISV